MVYNIFYNYELIIENIDIKVQQKMFNTYHIIYVGNLLTWNPTKLDFAFYDFLTKDSIEITYVFWKVPEVKKASFVGVMCSTSTPHRWAVK
jgi:hypothetical protein